MYTCICARVQGLPDLNQRKEKIRDKIVKFMNELLEMGVAGFRIDAAKHMWPKDLQAIYSALNNLSEYTFPIDSKPFIYQEVIDLGNEAVKKFVKCFLSLFFYSIASSTFILF